MTPTRSCRIFFLLALLSLWRGLPAYAQKSNAEALIRQADEAFDGNGDAVFKVEIAIDRLEFAVAADPESRVARMQLAYLYVDQRAYDFRHEKEHDEFVRKTYGDALAADPKNPLLLWDMAVFQFVSFGRTDSRVWVEKLLAVDPGSAAANALLATLDSWRLQPVIAAARKAARLSSGGYEPIPDAAIRAQLRQKYGATIDEGIAAARKALSLKPEIDVAFFALPSLLGYKSSCSEPSEAPKLAREITAAGGQLDAFIEAKHSGASPPSDPPKLMPGQLPPPADTRLVFPALIPPPPPPPSAASAAKTPKPPFKDLDDDDAVIETTNIPAAVHANRALVLWMWQPEKKEQHADSTGASDDCEKHLLGDYYTGQIYISLADTQTKTFLNTIDLLRPGAPASQHTDFQIPFHVAPGPYRVNHVDASGAGKPELLHLADLTGDGQAMQVALYNAPDCSEIFATVVGYSAKQDKVVHYRFLLEDKSQDGGYRDTFWVPTLPSQNPGVAGHWSYNVGRPAGSAAEHFEIRFDSAAEVFRGTVTPR